MQYGIHWRLSAEAERALAREVWKAGLLSDEFRSLVTHFNRAPAGEPGEQGGTPEAAIDILRARISVALDGLDEAVDKVLDERTEVEAAVGRWIWFAGCGVAVSIVVAFGVEVGGGSSLWSSGLSTASVSGLLALLYWPVQKRLAIADDRSNLRLAAMAFRVRFLAAEKPEEFRELGRELLDRLKLS